MKMTLTLLILCVVLLAAAGGLASGPLVVVTHTVTGYSAGETTTGIDISLRVSNLGEDTLRGLELSLAPVPPYFKGWSTLEIASLAPHQSGNLFLHLVAPSRYGRDDITQRPIHFIGKYQDAGGTPRGFPVTSQPGGAQ